MDPVKALPARSALEAHYYVMVQRCEACGEGPLGPYQDRREFHEGRQCYRVLTRCRACGRRAEFLFEAPGEAEAATPRPDEPVGGSTPSRIVDVAQWVTLFHTILRAASETRDKAEARRLGFEASQCLDEALKFYGQDEELPGRSAFFAEQRFRLSREHPEQFARSRLAAYREKLPSSGAMRARLRRDADRPGRGASWWRRLAARITGRR